MSRNKDKNEVEHLRGIIREQKSLIRDLKKRVGQMEKRNIHLENSVSEQEEKALEEMEADYTVPEKAGSRCPECSNLLEIVELGARSLHSCDGCGYRKTHKV